MISIITPFLNESENIKDLVNLFKIFKEKNNTLNFEFILVDDGSTDNSLEILDKIKVNINLKIIKLSRNFGSHAALRAGIDNASGDEIAFYYADMQDPIDIIIEMHDAYESGNDIVWATRESDSSSMIESFFSKKYASLMKSYAVENFPENGFDLVYFGQKVKTVLNNNIIANSSIFLQILSLGYSQIELGYHKEVRQKGKSKWTLSKKIKLFIDSFVSFSYAPLKLVSIAGGTMFVSGIFYSAYVILRKILVNDWGDGWPTLICFVLIGFGITNISLGIIAEYLWRTFDAARQSNVFLIDEIKTRKDK